MKTSALQFWQSSIQDYPILSPIAIDYLCRTTNSLDIQNLKKCRINEETRSMKMIMYFNGDVEGKLTY